MATIAIGCSGAANTERKEPVSPDPMLGMLHKGILQLTMNIEGLTKRMAELRQFPDTTDPSLRELRALDLSGWELHQQQWLIQRDHLQFAYELLQRAKASPAEKPQFLQQWIKHEQAFEKIMGDFRQQRHALEQQRLQLEAKGVERELR
ncbi:MAG TPA: hypothetical protein VJM82_08045 [Nitrospiraceae bacterium]|nr:hypothetical protein [Nitrospiraceae bacterium]